jgi:pyridoxamine 5'-phosphate oxidase
MKLLSQIALPTPLPTDPLAVVEAWLAEATQAQIQPNPNAMTLATATTDGKPSARIVLCKGLVKEPGYLVFVSNYLSRKGHELALNPRAAAVMHWDDLHRQVRLEGVIERAPASESDELHHVRPWQSRLGAWASEQSQPVSGRAALLTQLQAKARQFNTPPVGPDERPEDRDALVDIPRPPHWGAYRFYLDRVELWVEGEYRIHDRICYSRTLTTQPTLTVGAWQWQALQP